MFSGALPGEKRDKSMPLLRASTGTLKLLRSLGRRSAMASSVGMVAYSLFLRKLAK